MEGRQWIAQLYSNVFAFEHHRQHMGPQVGASAKLFPQPSKPEPMSRMRADGSTGQSLQPR